jgi:Ca2+-transporting ATPase
LNKVHDFTQKGYRVLGVARANAEMEKLPALQEEFQFDFLGLVAFYDPPKQNIAIVLRHFYHAGIQVKMITGDAVETAVAIAKQIQLDSNNYQHLSGVEVMQLDKETLRDRVKHVHIYARMFPEAKLKIIEALKANGEVVAMTGDGVNDAPALKAAHIGIAMGHRGSEIAKSTASLVLIDDDLSHMVEAIALGRRIYENLKKAIQYIISIHIPIMLLVMMPLVLGWHYTDLFSPVHVIFLELIMGPTCSIIFENEPIEANSMLKPPRNMGDNFLSFRELSLSLIQGTVISVFCLCVGYFYMDQGCSIEKARTILFSTLVFCNLFLTLANRSFTYSILTTIRYKNLLIPLILVVSLGILLMALYVPVVRNLFLFAELKPMELLSSFMVAFAAVMWVEVGKGNHKRPF